MRRRMHIATVILITGIAIYGGTWIWLRTHPWPMMTFTAWLLEHPTTYLGLGMTFLGLFILHREKRDTPTWLGLSMAVVITFLTAPAMPVLIMGAAVILIGFADLLNTRRQLI
jgi:hypothetical protein